MPGYIVISPVRNEAQHLPATIASMIGQTWPPDRWVIVDDGSCDGTAEIARKAAESVSWIRLLRRKDRGSRIAGSGVMDAFHDGLDSVASRHWYYLVKLDGDLAFGPNSFARALGEFSRSPNLGIGGGAVCIETESQPRLEYRDPPFHVRGPCKIYRRKCWEDIGGLIRSPGWDTFDLIKAQSRGWATRTFTDIPFIHLRPTGRAYGAWSNWVKNGLANYIVGYHPLFMALKCLRRVPQRPFCIAAGGLLTGFLLGYCQRAKQVNDREAIRFLRKQQLNYLTGRASLWRSGA